MKQHTPYILYRWIFLILFMCSTTDLLQAQSALKLGQTAPMVDQGMEDISGRTLSLEDVAESKGLLVIFSCNTCPWVAKGEGRYNELASIANNNDVGMVALNPNERIRNRGESLADMKKRAQKRNYTFPYMVDKDHRMADAFGATQTPEVFLFDANFRLVYHGALNREGGNNAGNSLEYAREALQALISGEEILQKQTKTQGCTIKRSE